MLVSRGVLRLRSGFVFWLRDEAWAGFGLFRMVALALWLARGAFLGVWRQVAPCTARHFLLSGQEKVTRHEGEKRCGRIKSSFFH